MTENDWMRAMENSLIAKMESVVFVVSGTDTMQEIRTKVA